MQEQMAGGRPTVEANILVCRQCGSEGFIEHKVTKRAVVRKCAHCGARTSVQGSVAVARVPADEAHYAREKRRVDPRPPEPEPETVGDDWADDAPADAAAEAPRYDYLRFSVLADQKAAIEDALEVYRIEHHGADEMRGQRWQGTALCNMAAEYRSGAPTWAQQIRDAAREALKQEIIELEARTGRVATQRQRTDCERKVRERLIRSMDKVLDAGPPLPTEPYEEAAQVNAQRAAERQAQAEADAADERVPDGDMLLDALRYAREELPEHVRHMMHVGGPERLREFAQMHERSGGYLLRVEGDERTKTPGGARPQAYVWLADDLSEQLDLGMAYDDVVDDLFPQPDLEVVELVPADYSDDNDEGWAMPDIAHRREALVLA